MRDESKSSMTNSSYIYSINKETTSKISFRTHQPIQVQNYLN